jgi:hypothetical protein
MFSRDGTRLAIGGGSWYGFGGIVLVDLASGATRVLRTEDLPLPPETPAPSVSGVWFSADDHHLVASTWTSGQSTGPIVLFEVSGLELRYRDTIIVSPTTPRHGHAPPTGLLLDAADVLVRNHRVSSADLVSFGQLPPEVDRTSAPRSLTSCPLVVAGDSVITGDHGLVMPDQAGACIVVVPRAGGEHVRHVVDGCHRITAIGTTRSGNQIVTGGGHGELHAWSGTDRWQARQLRGATHFERPDVGRHLAWATYDANSITALCALADEDRAVSVSASGHLCVFDPGPDAREPIDGWQLSELGTPRSLAADPDGRYVAVGIKQGGAGEPASTVSLVELRPRTIAPAWRTPAVCAMARVAANQRTPSGALDLDSLIVLADALEQAGCVEYLSHLRHHDPHLRTCGIVDALLEGS